MKEFYLITIFFLAGVFNVFSQESELATDSLLAEDSVYFENKRNYLGANISPLFTNAFGGANRNVKANVIYKRNFGDKNLRASFNYINIANKTPYLTFRTIESTDSTITNRYYDNWYKQYDVRIGFEEIKGNNWSRFHIGGDVILGYMQSYDNYSDYILQKDTSGIYRILNDEPEFTAYHDSYFFTAGVDVSFGFDWFLSEELAITFQITPQFNFYFLNKETLADQNQEYSSSLNYADFNLNYFDIMLFLKF